MMARDEWPLVALSAAHALTHHVDHLYVVDHASEDDSVVGLRGLAASFGSRISIVELDDVPYVQESVNAALGALALSDGFEWLYILDADEFAVAGPGGLRSALGALQPHVIAASYEVANWVAPSDFALGHPKDLLRIRARAVSCVNADHGADTAARIESGSITYFDVPFRDKVIVRTAPQRWIAAGAHDVRGERAGEVVALPPSQFAVAHLAMLERSRLGARAQAGRRLREAGFTEDHGWQAQMMWRVESRGELDHFWARHSLDESTGTGPNVTSDDSLADALTESLSGLEPFEFLVDRGRRRPVTSMSLDSALVTATRDLQAEVARLEQQVEAEQGYRTHAIEVLRAEVAEAQAELARVSWDLSALRNSRTWRLAQRVARFVPRRRAR